MAVESSSSSSMSKDLLSKNREGSEPKKKLKKTRSIKLLKVPSLKTSSRISKSRFSWVSIDLSDDDISSATSSSDAKTGNYQGGNETDDSVSVGSSSYVPVANGLPATNQSAGIKKVLKSTGNSRSFKRRVKANALATSRHPSSVDQTHNYLKVTGSSKGRKVYSQSRRGHPESIFNSSGGSESQSSTSLSVLDGQKSLPSFSRTPSMRSVKIMINKPDFKGKRSSLKSTPVPFDLHVDKATCSSTLKDSKFPEHVEIQAGQTAAERLSKMKVCPYHHCSLHGHSHDAAPPPKRPLHKKRQSVKSQESAKSISKESSSSMKFSGDREKEFHINQLNSDVQTSGEEGGIAIRILTPRGNDNGMGFSIQISSKQGANLSIKAGGEIKQAEVVEIFAGESSYHRKGQQASVDHMMISLPQTQDLTETSNLKGTSEMSSYDETEDRKLQLASVKLRSDDDSASNTGNRDRDSNDNGNADLSQESASALNLELNDQVRTFSNFDSQQGEGETSILTSNYSALDYNLLKDLETTSGEKSCSSDPETASVSGFERSDDSEKQFILARVSESSAHQGGSGVPIKKQKSNSMWQLIHQNMVSALAAESEKKPHDREISQKQAEDIDPLPAATVTDTSEVSSISDMRAEDHDRVNEDIELRKLFAIKLVREAIEKILLPEVPDQPSDDQSMTSDTISDQDHSESNFCEEYIEGSQKEGDQRKAEDISVAETKELGHTDNMIGPEDEKAETKLEKKTDKKAPKHWSNLKKWILIQRFTKALEKLKQLNPRKPRHLQLEPDPDAETVSLRHQTVDERKRSEEWMLDYALRQAVNQLAPTQKKKVALLVKAFESVKPPQEDSGVPLTFLKLKETKNESPRTGIVMDDSFSEGKITVKKPTDTLASGPDLQRTNSIADGEANNLHVPVVFDSQSVNNILVKLDEPQEILSSTSDKLHGEETVSKLNTNVPQESVSKTEGCEEIMSSALADISKNPITSRELTEKESDIEHSNLLEVNEDTSSSHNSVRLGTESIQLDTVYGKTNELSVGSEKILAQGGDVRQSITTGAAVSLTSETDAFSEQKTAEDERESRPEAIVLQGFYMDSKSSDNDNEEDKKNYIRMWHTVYQHVVSNIAEKFGSKLLEGTDDDEAEDENRLSEFSEKDQDAGDDSSSSLRKGGFSRSDAVKLVQEAVDEILLPEIQDDSSETQSVTSDTVQDQEIYEKNHTEGGEQNVISSPELIAGELGEETLKEDKKVDPLVPKLSKLPKSKNWSKLKKLILLKRSIRALEKARVGKSRQQKDLPSLTDPEPKKVDLRHQMSDERIKAEQWMLDYAVQHIVNKLTPARKKRVAMLVEAFEAVVPLPEM